MKRDNFLFYDTVWFQLIFLLLYLEINYRRMWRKSVPCSSEIVCNYWQSMLWRDIFSLWSGGGDVDWTKLNGGWWWTSGGLMMCRRNSRSTSSFVVRVLVTIVITYIYFQTTTASATNRTNMAPPSKLSSVCRGVSSACFKLSLDRRRRFGTNSLSSWVVLVSVWVV